MNFFVVGNVVVKLTRVCKKENDQRVHGRPLTNTSMFKLDTKELKVVLKPILVTYFLELGLIYL